ncbi:hypothetical protein F5B22DRAFT_565698 [Xylaria bambusicola]|uniref:uncharacterized protein n=1 Tax=Xylaria bambusicola TaxID=326684 RepID=UPI002007ED32|nr:uncharacterized protein F5B22DRAFT_565698 [Xylaria bambusicola]KAI0521192.1 hypothetical protein F5B22DRAFT_565698 [Xylaria bambusicola]
MSLFQTPPESACSPRSSISQASLAQRTGIYICEICWEHQSSTKELVDHLVSRHSSITQRAGSYHCGRSTCRKTVKSLKDFERHLISMHDDCNAPWHCRCGYTSRRKDRFRKHLDENKCREASPYTYACSCGSFAIDSRHDAASAIFKAHFDPCGRRRRGRPKKS